MKIKRKPVWMLVAIMVPLLLVVIVVCVGRLSQQGEENERDEQHRVPESGISSAGVGRGKLPRAASKVPKPTLSLARDCVRRRCNADELYREMGKPEYVQDCSEKLVKLMRAYFKTEQDKWIVCEILMGVVIDAKFSSPPKRVPFRHIIDPPKDPSALPDSAFIGPRIELPHSYANDQSTSAKEANSVSKPNGTRK